MGLLARSRQVPQNTGKKKEGKKKKGSEGLQSVRWCGEQHRPTSQPTNKNTQEEGRRGGKKKWRRVGRNKKRCYVTMHSNNKETDLFFFLYSTITCNFLFISLPVLFRSFPRPSVWNIKEKRMKERGK